MKITSSQTGKLIALANGMALPASALKGEIFHEMQEEGILITMAHGSKRSIRAADEQTLRRYVAEKYNISDLEACHKLLAEDADRAAQVKVTGDSKFASHRTFRGFLVNSCQPIHATLHGSPFTIAPPDGTYTFIYDYEAFSIPGDVVVVGMENAENFRHISRQRSLFKESIPNDAPILFVSRYPQNGDLVRWLQSIGNRYIHFGDLDLAGIHIYQTEFYRHLGDRASFLIPSDYEARIQCGSKERYTAQYPKYHDMPIIDHRVKPLADCINQYHRGYDQEGYIEDLTHIL